MDPVLEGEGPLYRRLARGLQTAIDSGGYAVGQRLPGVRELSRSLGLSLNTVHHALSLLESAGSIEMRPQSGCFVARRAQTPGPIEVRRADWTMRVLDEANRNELQRLGATMPNADLLPTRQIRRLMAGLGREDWPNRYDFPRGSPQLRQQIARTMLRAGVSVGPDDVLLSSGCQEAVVACLRALCREGDTVAIESPTFYGYLEALQMLQLRALEIPNHPRHGLDLDALRQALQAFPVRCLVATPNFSNPQGSLISEADKRELVALLSHHGVRLIENDIQGELYFREPRPLACRAFDPSVLYCSSFSKTLGPECRVGWVLAGSDTAAVERVLTFQSFGSSSLTRQALGLFLDSGAYRTALRRARQAYARQSELVRAALADLPEGSRVNRPAGGKMLWVELPARIDVLTLAERSRQEGISLSPGPLYSVHGHFRNCMRLNCSFWSEEVEVSLRRLCQLARD